MGYFVENEIIGEPIWIGDFLNNFIALLCHVFFYLIFALLVMDKLDG